MLNSDQQQALEQILRWYRGNKLNLILSGRGGRGKSYLLNYVLKELKDTKVICLASTNEALEQFRSKVDNPDHYMFKTTHSSLGIVPTEGKDLEFKQMSLPSFWGDFELCLVDESSMTDTAIMNILLDIGIKILWIGDKEQHAPVEKGISTSSKCISPVFTQGFQEVTLTIPMRNGGELAAFCDLVADNVESGKRFIPSTYDVSKQTLVSYLTSDKGIEDCHLGRTKILAYSNAAVIKYNYYVRSLIFGSLAITNLYLPTDRIILTKPCCIVDSYEAITDRELKKANYKGMVNLYSNTKLEVMNVSTTEITLNTKLSNIPCYKLECEDKNDTKYTLFSLINNEDYKRIADYYEHLAWGQKDRAAKIKIFQLRRLILSSFAEILHYYAATTHRVQGASIPNVVVLYQDIMKVNNVILQNKALNVACGRTQENLMFYRGML